MQENCVDGLEKNKISLCVLANLNGKTSMQQLAFYYQTTALLML
jgi:hypothetical protein